MIELGHLNHYQTMPQPHMVKLNLEEGFGLSSSVEPQILSNQIQIEIQNLNLLQSLLHLIKINSFQILLTKV